MPDDSKERIRGLLDATTRTGTTNLPKLPYVPIPKAVANRIPELAQWYEDWFRQMERWRQEADRAIRGPQF